MKINTLVFAVGSLAFVCANTCKGDEPRIAIYMHEAYAVTNEWMVSMSHLDKLPPWKPDEEEPAISVRKAVVLAKAWIISKGSAKEPWVERIEIRPVRYGSGKYGNIFYYNILFGGVGYYQNHMRCLVLMDGAIVEPERDGKPVNSTSYKDYVE